MATPATDRLADKTAVAFCFFNGCFLYSALLDKPHLASIEHWEDACFLDYSVNKAAVD